MLKCVVGDCFEKRCKSTLFWGFMQEKNMIKAIFARNKTRFSTRLFKVGQIAVLFSPACINPD